MPADTTMIWNAILSLACGSFSVVDANYEYASIGSSTEGYQIPERRLPRPMLPRLMWKRISEKSWTGSTSWKRN